MPRMYVDASRDRLSLGIEWGDLWAVAEHIDGRHDAVLLESLTALCQRCQLGLDAIDQAVVVNGPGSFTGLRIAVSMIHALDLVQPLRVLPIDQLSWLASAAPGVTEAAIDARMNEVYLGRMPGETGLFQHVSVVARADWEPGASTACHHHEAALFPGVKTVHPSLDDLRTLAHRQPDSCWIPGTQLVPQYVRHGVNWKPLAEQPSRLYDR